jgi:glycosyltransferase involved in cell wall biosynthesis
MALGVPTIATAIGTIHRIIEDGQNGFLVNSREEWKKKITALLINEDLRKEIGREAVITVEQSYSIHANKDKYLDILNTLSK